jgi:hypothetical protein
MRTSNSMSNGREAPCLGRDPTRAPMVSTLARPYPPANL